MIIDCLFPIYVSNNILSSRNILVFFKCVIFNLGKHCFHKILYESIVAYFHSFRWLFIFRSQQSNTFR